MKTTDFEFIAAVARIYSEAIGKGFDLPLYLVAVGANGSVMAERNEGMEEQWTLAEHYEGDSLELPINLFVGTLSANVLDNGWYVNIHCQTHLPKGYGRSADPASTSPPLRW